MLNRKGQSTVEYALIIAVVIAGLLLMQHYIKRGYAGKLKSSADDMGEQFDPVTYSATFNKGENSQTQQTVGIAGPGVHETTYTGAGKVETKTGQEAVGAWTPGDNTLYNQ